MFLRRLLKDCSSQLQRHPQRTMSYVSKMLNLSKNPNLVQQQKYLHRMTPLHHETDHEVLSRPDEITCTFITKDGQRISVKGKIFIRSTEFGKNFINEAYMYFNDHKNCI